MERKSLLDKLGIVAPALADNDLIPVLTHFWFLGDRVMAYNDAIGISTPLQTDFQGAVPGTTLLELLKASRAKDVELLIDKDDLFVKAASSRFRLGLRPVEDFVFEMPDRPADGGPGGMPGDRKRFMAAIENCMRSVSTDTSVPDQLGVTVITSDTSVSLFATNHATLSAVDIELKGKPSNKGRVILSGSFCREMLKLQVNSKKQALFITKEYSLFCADETVLYGRLIHSSHPLDFKAIFAHHFPTVGTSGLASIPTKLQGILDRAIIITAFKVDQTSTHISVRDGKMRFHSKSDRGEVTDVMLVEDTQGEVSVRLDPKLLKAGIGSFDKMLITDKCAIMAAGDMYYLVSATEH